MTAQTEASADQQFTAREVPWMKLGNLEDGAKTLGEAIKLGGMDFTVSARPAAFLDAKGEWIRSSNRVAVVADDTEEEFEYVSTGYEMLQYHEAFDFMDAISPRYVAAGTLRNRRQGFIVVQPDGGDTKVSPGGDDHEMFIVLRTSHDRSRAIELAFMPLRGACMNQLTLRSFAAGVKHRWSIPHTSTMRDKLAQAHRAMAQLDDYTTAFNRLAEKLMLIKPTDGQARKMIDEAMFFGGTDKYARKVIVDDVVKLWHQDEERVGFNDTGWGLVNAMSEYVEWQRRGRKDNVESRFLTALNGPAHQALNGIVKNTLALAS